MATKTLLIGKPLLIRPGLILLLEKSPEVGIHIRELFLHYQTLIGIPSTRGVLCNLSEWRALIAAAADVRSWVFKRAFSVTGGSVYLSERTRVWVSQPFRINMSQRLGNETTELSIGFADFNKNY
jgi:hypothetical protein